MIHGNGLNYLLLSVIAGCSGAPGAPDGGAVDDAGLALDADMAADGASAATVYVHLVSTHEPVTHAAGTEGQTPRDWVSGIRSLQLLRREDDPAPLLVFSHGDGFVEGSYADGADTIVGSAPIADLVPGTYAWARVVHTHVRFTIDATLHAGFGPMPGELDDLLVLSDRTTLDGVERARGDYRFTFRSAGMSFPTEGSGFVVDPIAGGGFTTRVEDGETAYFFPVSLLVNDRLTEDMHVYFAVNVHEGFRWTDSAMTDYESGVFDMTPLGTEPIVQAGANEYSYRLSETGRP